MSPYVLAIHAIATWKNKVRHDHCLVVPRDGEEAIEFLERVQRRCQSLRIDFETTALFDKAPTNLLFALAAMSIDCGEHARSVEAARQLLNKKLAWRGLEATGKSAKVLAATAGAMTALFEAGNEVAHV
jgi:hypothetical protein